MREINIFCDGSAKGSTPNYFCGYGVYSKDMRVKYSQKCMPVGEHTNNTAELLGLITSMRYVLQYEEKENNPRNKYHIYMDSMYCYNTVTDWIYTYMNPEKYHQKNGKAVKGKRQVANFKLIKWMWNIMRELEYKNIKVEYHHVMSHGKGDYPEELRIGNDEADKLATEASEAVKEEWIKNNQEV